MENRVLRFCVQGLGFTLAYVASAKLGYHFALTPSGVSPIWPPTGIALACTILFGYRLLPFVFIAAHIAHTFGSMSFTAGILSALGNTIEAGVGTFLCYRLIPNRNPLNRPRDLTAFLLGPVLLSTAVGALLGITSLCLGGDAKWTDFPSLFQVWWLGDIFGDVIVAPFILAWSRGLRNFKASQLVEAGILVVLTFVVAQIVFGDWMPAGYCNYPIEHLCIPVLLWSTFRFGRRGSTTSTLIITVIAALGTAQGFGPYYLGSKGESMHLLQLFIGTSSITMLFVAAVRVLHRSAADKLKESETLYQTVIQDLPLNIFRKDINSRLQFANQEYLRTLGEKLEDVIGKTDFEIFDADMASKYISDDRKVMQTKTPLHTVEKFRDKHGRETYIQVCKSPVSDTNGDIVGLQGAFWDVTEAKQAETKLREAKKIADAANKAKSKFLANMSHEMRTPLGAILGFVERMALPNRTEPQRLGDAARIRRSVRSMTELIDDILDLSKVEAGKLKIENLDTDLLLELEDIYLLLLPQATAKGLKLRFEFEGMIPKIITTDPHRMRQILINIVGNAIKFTHKGEVLVVVKLENTVSDYSLTIVVNDTGCGIALPQRSQLFQPFVQADSSTTRKFGGTGLGLILSRRLARALGGDVTLLESTPNIGSCFKISLACQVKENTQFVEVSNFPEKSATQPVAMPTHAGRLKGLRILLVEDGPDNQELIAFFLSASGAQVDVAPNGQEAVRLAQQNLYDLILMDIQMPVLDGYGATRQLRIQGFTGPIVALTAHAMIEEKQKCFDAGCDGYITKPVFRDTLIETVDHFGKSRSVAAH